MESHLVDDTVENEMHYLRSNVRTANERRVNNMFFSGLFAQFMKYEWLYTPIDRELFLNYNDFQVILLEHFSKLKRRQLTRAHWHCIRRMIGRPRRFSFAFIAEERKTVIEKREHLQFLQILYQNSHIAHNLLNQAELAIVNFSDKDRIPLRLSQGTAVCASIVAPAKGFYLGVIQHPLNTETSYNVLIDKLMFANTVISDANFQASTILGNYMVPEADIFPIFTTSTSLITVSNFRSYIKQRMFIGGDSKHIGMRYLDDESVSYDVNSNFKKSLTIQPSFSKEFESKHGPMNGSIDCLSRIPVNMSYNSTILPLVDDSGDHCNVMSTFLASLAKSYRIVFEKQKAVADLQALNDDAEMNLESDSNYITAEFQHKYATLILHLDELNRELKHHIGVVLVYITEPSSHIVPVETGFQLESQYPIIMQAPVSTMSNYIPQESTEDISLAVPVESCQAVGIFDANGVQDLTSASTSSMTADCDVAADYGMHNIPYLTDWRRRCEDEAFELVNRLKTAQGRSIADESKSVLVAKLTSILTLLAHLQDNRMTNDELNCIEKVFADIRQSLHPSNLKCFEQSVEQLISHIVLNLSPSILSAPQPCTGQSNYPSGCNS